MVRGLDCGQPIPVTPDYAHFLTPDYAHFLTPDYAHFLTPDYAHFLTPDYAHFLTPDEIGWSTPPLSLPHARRLRLVAAGLARAFLRGPWDQDGLVARGASVLGRRWCWLGWSWPRWFSSTRNSKRILVC